MLLLILLSLRSASSASQLFTAQEDYSVFLQPSAAGVGNGPVWTGTGGVGVAPGLLADDGAGAGSGSAPSAHAVADAGQLQVGRRESDGRRGSGCKTGSAGPKETTATAGELRDPAPAAGLTGGSQTR